MATTDQPALRGLAAAVLPLGAATSLGLAITLSTYTRTLLSGLSPATQVDTVIVLAAVILGALLATWCGLHLLVASTCVAGAALGRRWRAGERFVAARGPALVRRGLAGALGVSIGLGGAVAASASELAGPGDPSTAVASSEIDLGDLGWRPTPDAEADDDASQDPGPDLTLDELDRPGGEDDATHPIETEAPLDEESPVVLVVDPPTDEALEGGDAPEVPAPDQADPGLDRTNDAVAHTPDVDPAPDVDHDDSEARRDEGQPRASDQADRVERYVVQAGDSLWSITRELLDGAGDARVASTWPVLYEANRHTVGADPDLIHPGQELVIPTTVKELS